jgi:hypothetical protein
MGIGEAFKKLGKGQIRDKCDKNPETGEVMCRKTRVNSDGTTVDLAGFTMQADANCNPQQTSSYENESGALDALEKKYVPKIVGKCKNTPVDY